ncbi:MAG: hypothetical protein JWL79_3749 [Frankiales bacterium]|nr:hypothetical protein [Frankiales bacterium]
MGPLILLDVDGVVNILGEDDSPDGWDVVCSGRATAEGNTYPIVWSPEVVAALTRWLDDGVEIQWLTTWGHDANRSLRELIDLPELPVAGTYDHEPAGVPEEPGRSHASDAPSAPDPLTGQWWKYDVVQRILREQPERTLIWIDDELHGAMRFREWADEHPQVHAIGPDGDLGLTAADLVAIEALLYPPEP